MNVTNNPVSGNHQRSGQCHELILTRFHVSNITKFHNDSICWAMLLIYLFYYACHYNPFYYLVLFYDIVLIFSQVVLLISNLAIWPQNIVYFQYCINPIININNMDSRIMLIGESHFRIWSSEKSFWYPARTNI